MRRKNLSLLLLAVVLMSSFVYAIQKQYSPGKLVSVQRKSREKVDMYLVNTPVTTAVPYFEITVRLADTDYVGEYTPRRTEEELPAEWVAGADVEVRMAKHSLFLKRSDGSEMQWILVRRIRMKEKKE